MDLYLETLLSQLVKAVQEASLETRPCESIHLSEIFDESLYREIVRRLPPAISMDNISHPDAVTEDGRVTRKLIDLTEASLVRFLDQHRQFWRDMMYGFCSAELRDALCEKFKKTIADRFGNMIPEMVIVPIIFRDYPRYRMGGHPGSLGEIVTLQINLSPDSGQAHLGTSFHASADEGFQVLRKHLFLPNSGYAFARSDESLHSVDQMVPNEFTRNSIAITLYLAGQECRSEPRIETSFVAQALSTPATTTREDGALYGVRRASELL